MGTFLIYRHGSNKANQHMTDTMPVAIEDGTSEDEACTSASKTYEARCYANQHLSAVPEESLTDEQIEDWNSVVERRARIRIDEVSGTDLYRRYSGQTEAQDCYVQLNAATGRLTAAYNGEIGNAVPMAVWHRHTLRWSIPALKAEAANALLEQIRPLAERVVEGYESVWDGNNHVAEYSDDAQVATDEIERLCENVDDEGKIVVWDAADWVGAIGSRDAQRASVKITAATTDKELDEIEADLIGIAANDGIDEVEGLAKYLRGLRDEARDEARDESADEYRAYDTTTEWRGPARDTVSAAEEDAQCHNRGCESQGGYGSAIVVQRSEDGGRCQHLDGSPVWPPHGRGCGAVRWRDWP